MESEVERLVAQWRDTDKHRYAAESQAKAAELFAALEALHLRIFREGDKGIDAFARLLEDPDDRVRIDAAAALLPHRPRVAKAILEQAAGRSLTARYVLSEWGRSSVETTAGDDGESEESARTRITRFYASIDERFEWLGSLGFRRAITERAGVRAAQVRWEGGRRYLEITYDTVDGSLDVYIGGGEFSMRDSVWTTIRTPSCTSARWCSASSTTGSRILGPGTASSRPASRIRWPRRPARSAW